MSQIANEYNMPPSPPVTQTDERATVRRACSVQAVSRPLELTEAMTWGAVLRDISSTGIGLVVCYPFKPGTYLAIDLATTSSPRSILGRVIHATDQSDGTWFVGCELVQKLNDSDMDILV